MKKLRLICLIFITVFAFLYGNGSAQTKDDCLDCHDDPEFTTEIDGKEISLNVSGEKFNYSAHKKLNCVACHKGYDPEEIPHYENAAEVNCLSCHQKSKQKHLFHPQILNANGTESTPGVSCINCHGNHYVQSPKKDG